MPRMSSVRYFKSRQGYYTKMAGRQYALARGPEDGPDGPTYKAAVAAFAELVAQSGRLGQPSQHNFRTVCNMYLTNKKDRLQPSTFAMRTAYLKVFLGQYPEIRCEQVSPGLVENFLAGRRAGFHRRTKTGKMVRRSWNANTCSTCVRILKQVTAWAVRRNILAENPLSRLERPTEIARTSYCLVSKEQHEAILAACGYETLRDICLLLEATGARPAEILAAQQRYWLKERQAIVYLSDRTRRPGHYRHKRAAYVDRTIYFTGTALEVMQRRLRENPSGPIFITQQQTAFTPHHLCKQLRRLGRLTGLEGFTAYSYRHTFITRWLEQGRPIEPLAELVGTSATIIRKHYSHLCEQWQSLRGFLEQFRAD